MFDVYFLLYSPAVSFCGYTVPHPMERKIHVRIQTNKVPAVQVLRQALKELKQQNECISQMIKVGMQGGAWEMSVIFCIFLANKFKNLSTLLENRDQLFTCTLLLNLFENSFIYHCWKIVFFSIHKINIFSAILFMFFYI